MKLIDKNDLEFQDGFLVDKELGILAFSNLAKEANEIVEIEKFIQFLEDNQDKIEASTHKVTYKPERMDKPRLTIDKKIDTPASDASRRQAERIANEFEEIMALKRAEDHLKRYPELARWFNEKHVIPRPAEAVPIRFYEDITEWTKEDVLITIEAYYSPEITKLRNLVKIDFS